jgi:hypothetical protein
MTRHLPALCTLNSEKAVDCDHWVYCTSYTSSSDTCLHGAHWIKAVDCDHWMCCTGYMSSMTRHLPAWCTLNSDKAVDCDTGCAARSISAAETTACMVHTLERSQKAAITGYRKCMPMHTHAHAIDGLWRTCNQCAAMNVCQSRSSIQECSLCLAGKHSDTCTLSSYFRISRTHFRNNSALVLVHAVPKTINLY